MNRQDAKHTKNAKEVAGEWRDTVFSTGFVSIAAWRPWRLGGSISALKHTITKATEGRPYKSVAKVLSDHQTAHSAIHNADADSSKLRIEDIAAVTR